MQNQHKEIEAFLQSMLAARQKAQILRVRDQWEPQIVVPLTSLADASLALLRHHLGGSSGGSGAEGDQDPAWLAGRLAALKEEHTQRGLALLAEMVNKECKVTSEIADFDGLAPGLEELGLSAGKLAGGPALRESVERAYAEYLKRVKAVLRQAGSRGSSLTDLSRALEAPARLWRNSLKRVAITLTHAVFNRAKVEVGMVYLRRAA